MTGAEDEPSFNKEVDPDLTVPMDQSVSFSPNTSDQPKPPANPTVSLTPPGKWQAPSVEELIIPGYRIVGMLGRGGMGAVYEGVHEDLDRRVAIKILPPELAADPEFEARFRREARAMAKLNHTHIVQIYDFGQTDNGEFYLAMEYVDGSDLHKLLRAGKIDEKTALQLIDQICDALQYAHDKGFVHRDIKPANIILNSEGQVKVGDFGLAKIVDSEADGDQMGLTMTGISMGTPHYMAPEQMMGSEELDHRVDIYSLGVMFYELLTGEIPRGNFPPPSKKVAKFDEQIDDVVLKAMASDPVERYQAASDIRKDVNTVYTQVFEKVVDGKNEERSVQKTSPVLTLVIGLCLVGLLVAGMLVYKADLIPGLGPARPDETAATTPLHNSDSPSVGNRTIRLPPAIEKLKQKGGKVRGWGVSSNGNPVVATFPGHPDDMVELHFARIDGWIPGTRADGSVFRKKDDPEGLQRISVVTCYYHVDGSGGIEHRYKNVFNPPIEDVRKGLPQIIDVAGGGIWHAFLLPNGTVRLARVENAQDDFKISALEDAVKALTDVVDIDSRTPWGFAALRNDGSALFCDLESGKTYDTGPMNLIQIVGDARNHWLALDRDGKIHTGNLWADQKPIETPVGLPRVVALRADHHMRAAQLEDGTWRAWGVKGHQTLIDKINEIGVAIDLDFATWANADGNAALYWIEPST